MSTCSQFPPSPQEKNVGKGQSSGGNAVQTTNRTVPLDLGDWLGATCGMTCEQEGAYIGFLTSLHISGSRLPDDDAKVAARMGMSVRVWRRLRADLLERGAIVRLGGHLTAPQFERGRSPARGVAASEVYPREAIPMATRREVYERDGHRCRKCGSDRRLSLDHVIPVTSGGDNSADNLQTLCLPCNLKKGSRNGVGA